MKSLKTAGLALLLLIAVDELVPSIALSFIPHELVSRPDPRREPRQEEVSPGRAPWSVKRYWTVFRITPRASYDIAARVVARDVYHFGATNALMPVDLALAWGRVVDEPYRSRINYLHTPRFIIWNTRDASLDPDYIAAHVANVHLVASNRRVAAAIARARAGDVVRLEGDLVDISRPDGFEWKTSLSRTDRGPGACETMYVRAVTVGKRRYR